MKFVCTNSRVTRVLRYRSVVEFLLSNRTSVTSYGYSSVFYFRLAEMASSTFQ